MKSIIHLLMTNICLEKKKMKRFVFVLEFSVSGSCYLFSFLPFFSSFNESFVLFSLLELSSFSLCPLFVAHFFHYPKLTFCFRKPLFLTMKRVSFYSPFSFRLLFFFLFSILLFVFLVCQFQIIYCSFR